MRSGTQHGLAALGRACVLTQRIGPYGRDDDASTPIRRAALGLSRLGTVALEGFRASDFSRLPVSEPPYLRPDDGGSHLRTFRLGLGAIGLTVVDSVANTGLFVTRAIGANEVEEQLARAKTDVRTAWVGPATDGETESGAVSLAVQQPS